MGIESNVEEYVKQAQMLLQVQEYEAAGKYADKALAEDKMCLDAWVIKGVALADVKDFDSSKECFEKAVMIDKNVAEPHYHLGVVHFIQGNTDAGIKETNLAIELGYDTQEIYFNLGLVYETEGDDEKAVRNYNRAIKKDELNPYPHLRKAMVYLNRSQYAAGLQALEDMRKNCPDCYEGYHYAAAAYIAMGDAGSADELLVKAEERFPDDIDILIDRIKVLVALGKNSEALSKTEAALQTATNSLHRKELMLSKAKLVGLDSNVDGALTMLDEALNLGADESIDSEICYLLVNGYLSKQDYAKVKEYALKLAEIPDTNNYALGAQYYLALAESNLQPATKQEVYKKAIFYYRSLTLSNPGRIEAYLFRAVCLKDIGDYEKALEMIEYVTNFATDIPGLDVMKASVLDAMGKKDTSKELLKNASQKGNTIAQFMLDNQE